MFNLLERSTPYDYKKAQVAVSMGRALSKIEELSAFGKEVRTFRLFDGKTYDSEEAVLPVEKHNKMKGGRFRSKSKEST